MLKIKDNVDLRKMQPNKLKFKGIIVLPDRTIFLEKTELLYVQKLQLDTLYDLIQADLIEKVVERYE